MTVTRDWPATSKVGMARGESPGSTDLGPDSMSDSASAPQSKLRLTSDIAGPRSVGNHIPIALQKVRPCGVEDPAARVLLPVHYDCPGCKALIAVALIGRRGTITVKRHKQPVQTEMFPEPKVKKRRKRVQEEDVPTDVGVIPEP